MLTTPGRRIWLRRDATRAPTQGPECVGGVEPPPRHSGEKAINPGSARAEPSQASSVVGASVSDCCFRAPALRPAFEHVPMMQQPVEHGSYRRNVGQQFTPVIHGAV